MSERDPNRVLLDSGDVNIAFDVWLKRERDRRNFGVDRGEQIAFLQGLLAANAIILSRMERQKHE